MRNLRKGNTMICAFILFIMQVRDSSKSSMLFSFLSVFIPASSVVLANGFLPSNLLEGGVVSLGGYEQCLHTAARGRNGDAYIKGQYCSLFLQPPRHVMEEIVRRFNQDGDLQASNHHHVGKL